MKTISFLPENFEEIKGHLKRGNLVVFATESSYGISGDITIPRTIKRAEQIKQREPQKQAFLCLVAQFSEMEKWGDTTFLTPKLKKEAEEIPTTFILPKSKIFPKFYFPSFQKIGIRKTLYKPLEGFLHFYKTPIFSTSANFSGEEAIYDEKVIQEKFSQYKDLLLVKSGNLEKKPPSQIIDVEKEGIKKLRKYTH